MTRVVLGLGANLGDRRATLSEAARRIASNIAPIEAASWVYETAPVGPPQPHYLNAAVLLRWPDDDLRGLLARLLEVELSLGRVRAERWGPRTIDVDILWADEVALASPELTVPHPRLHERAFAVLPLLDVAPDAPYRVPPTPPGEVERFAPPSDWFIVPAVAQ
ncbi:2-amino-4-hydroxy-6-hydroxymethyldihydropteridine diphosphokinase [Pendulispora albinea]|uniref:2-amino-4-hydroxy-6-hydroxymethyldihydropteridine pyrophosphokinase n=1 Tax=Pendulispora albinea TaxID=2741071 RepID=A0ABZ2M149_9BACT